MKSLRSASRSASAQSNDASFNAAVFEEIQKMGKDFRGYERPQKIAITLDEFSIDNGLLTPALKLKRYAIEKKYKERINALYD